MPIHAPPFLKIENYGAVSFNNKDDFEKIMVAITETAKKRLEKDGKLVMTKVVGGFIATK